MNGLDGVKIVNLCFSCWGRGYHIYYINREQIPGNPTEVMIACGRCCGSGLEDNEDVRE